MNCKINYLIKEFLWINFWLYVINYLCWWDWIILFVMLEYVFYVFKKDIWRYKKVLNIVLDIIVNLCNKNVKKFVRLNGFFVVLDNLNIIVFWYIFIEGNIDIVFKNILIKFLLLDSVKKF